MESPSSHFCGRWHLDLLPSIGECGKEPEYGPQVVKNERCQEESGVGTYLSGISKLLSSPLSLKVWFSGLQLWSYLLLLFSCSVVSNSLWPQGLHTSGLPVLHSFPKFAQTHVHWVDDAIQPSHPPLPPFSFCPQSFPASGSFLRVGSSHQVAKVLEL